MTIACSDCGTTEFGSRFGRSHLCETCDRAALRKASERFNRIAQDRALARQQHPSGTSPRYRTSLLWRTCTCNTPSPCWHGGAEAL